MIRIKKKSNGLFLLFFLMIHQSGIAQINLLLNGGFEQVNTCTEYKAECGVEAWFYLKDVKVQMLSNEVGTSMLGQNSFGIFYNWKGFTGFTPVIGTLLPCRLQAGKEYIFKGLISAKLHPQLMLIPGICLGNYFYVPGRPFAKDLNPDSIPAVRKSAAIGMFAFEYRFTASGEERYLSFGTYIREDTSGAKKKLIGTQTVNLVLDQFELVPADPEETYCPGFFIQQEAIYQYDYRHREMDYSLFGKGELNIRLPAADSMAVTRRRDPPLLPPQSDTLLLGDVLFDFNKAILRPEAAKLLTQYFSKINPAAIDSILIEGHTDSIGTDQRNQLLSRQRCETVQAWFRQYWKEGTPLLFIHPFGRTRPVATNRTVAGRTLNRRVELIIFHRRN